MNTMEFRNVVFNAARDGKLRRLKVKRRRVKKQFYDSVPTFVAGGIDQTNCSSAVLSYSGSKIP